MKRKSTILDNVEEEAILYSSIYSLIRTLFFIQENAILSAISKAYGAEKK